MKSNLTSKAALAVIIAFSGISISFSQQTVAIGDSNPKANAILYLKGNGNQGLIIPIVSSLGSFGEAGMVVYNSADKKIHFHDGSTWNVVGGGGGGIAVDPVIGNEVTGVGTTGGVVVSGAGTAGDPLKISMIAGTTNGQVLKWNSATSKWELGTDNTGSVMLTSAQILVGNSSNVATPMIVSGDAQLSNTGALTISTNAINSAKIIDGTITNADLAAAAAIAPSKIGQAGATTSQVLKWNGTAWAPAADDAGAVALNSGQILVGNASNVPTPVMVSGDAQLSNAGVLTIANNAVNSNKIIDGTITNADLATSAAIAPSKIGQAGATTSQVLKWNGTTWAPAADDAGAVALNSGQILVGNASNVPTAVMMSGDGSLSNTGALTIANNAVTSAKIADGVISSADVADNAIMNADINAGAAIDGSKINPNFGAQYVTTTGNLSAGGTVNFNALAGTGTRMVVASSTGALGTQAIPSAFSTLNRIPKGDGISGMTNSLFFDDGANVGLGTTAPAFLLDVNKALASAADANIRVYNPSDTDGAKAGIRFGVGSFWAVHLNTVLNGNWLELTNNAGTPYHRWDASNYWPGGGAAYIQGTGTNLAFLGGYTGIGTNTPDRHLEVSSSNYKVARFTSTSSGAGIELVSTNNDDWLMTTWNNNLYLSWSNDDFANQTDQYLFTTGSFYPSQDNAKSLGAGSRRWTAVYAVNGTVQTSDARMKTNIKTLSYGLNEVLKLKPVSYSWKSDVASRKIGLIAQEVQQLVPEVVTGDETLGMNYGELVPVLINAIQEQQRTIAALEEKIKKIQAEHADLEALKAEVAAITKALGMDAKAEK